MQQASWELSKDDAEKNTILESARVWVMQICHKLRTKRTFEALQSVSVRICVDVCSPACSLWPHGLICGESTLHCVHARLPAESIWIGMRKNRSVGWRERLSSKTRTRVLKPLQPLSAFILHLLCSYASRQWQYHRLRHVITAAVWRLVLGVWV